MSQCYIHPEKQSNATCDRCNRPVCNEDLRKFDTKKMEGGIMKITKINACSTCIREIKKNRAKQTRRTITIMITAMVIISAIVALLWYFEFL